MVGGNLRLLHVNKIREYRARVQTVGVVYDIDDEFEQLAPKRSKQLAPKRSEQLAQKRSEQLVQKRKQLAQKRSEQSTVFLAAW
ncbi:hypothetical protein TNCV_3062191 [Trichonephila clavipes]|nr:hypothetical protein TNCV_3062191 [Trichonephila clavipes]